MSDTETQVEAIETPSYAGGAPALPAEPTCPFLRAERGHYCLHEQRGDRCPGPSGCSTVGAEVTANPCFKGGVRDGFRCTHCGCWSETPRGITHRHETCVVRPPAKRGRR